MEEKVSGYVDCFSISRILKGKRISLSPVEIAEAHGIPIPSNEISSAPKTTLAFLHSVLSEIQNSEDLEEISDLMVEDFWNKTIREQGEKRLAEIVSATLQSRQCSLDELLEMNQHTYVGGKSRNMIDEGIYKECFRLYDPESKWEDKLSLLKHLRSGSKGKAIFVDMLLENGKANLSHDDMRQLLTNISPTAEIKLYQKVVRFIVEHF